MFEAATPEGTVAALRSIGAYRIGVDGADGAGKSTLAGMLSTSLGLPLFHLDDFVAKHQGAYLSQLDAASLHAALASASCGFIVEGVCLLKALGQAQTQIDAAVYVKRVNEIEWLDEYELVPSLPIDEHLATLRLDIQALAKSASVDLGLLEELVRYHVEFKPHASASVVYLRSDG